MNRKLIVVSFVVFVFSLAAYPIKPSHNPGWADGSGIGQAIMVLAVLIAAIVLILVSFVALFDRRSRVTGWICLALCLPMPASMIYGEIKRSNRVADMIKWRDWGMLAKKVTPLLIEYQKLHPERFGYVSDQSEEVNIAGFPEFALSRNKSLPSQVANGFVEILDPWNEPICFVMSRGDDEEIVCRGFRQGITFGGGDDAAFNNPKGLGVARSKPKQVIANGRYQETILVYMNVSFSKRDIEDRKQRLKYQ